MPLSSRGITAKMITTINAVTSFRDPLLGAYQAIANQLTTAGNTITTPN